MATFSVRNRISSVASPPTARTQLLADGRPIREELRALLEQAARRRARSKRCRIFANDCSSAGRPSTAISPSGAGPIRVSAPSNGYCRPLWPARRFAGCGRECRVGDPTGPCPRTQTRAVVRAPRDPMVSLRARLTDVLVVIQPNGLRSPHSPQDAEYSGRTSVNQSESGAPTASQPPVSSSQASLRQTCEAERVA